jgi:hypothetical protein
MSDDELSRKRALREARNDPEFDLFTDGMAAIMWQTGKDSEEGRKKAGVFPLNESNQF